MQKEIEAISSNRLAIIVHILGILTFFIGPLLVKKFADNTSARLNAKNALNWQINVIIFILVSLILKVVFVGYIIVPAVLVLNVAFSIVAAIKASKNEIWEYPFSFQFLN